MLSRPAVLLWLACDWLILDFSRYCARYKFFSCLMRFLQINPTSFFGTRSKLTTRFFLGDEPRLARWMLYQQKTIELFRIFNEGKVDKIAIEMSHSQEHVSSALRSN
jgi:hypothetical protein